MKLDTFVPRLLLVCGVLASNRQSSSAQAECNTPDSTTITFNSEEDLESKLRSLLIEKLNLEGNQEYKWSMTTSCSGETTSVNGGITSPSTEATSIITPTDELTTPTYKVTTPTNEIATATNEVTTPTDEVTTPTKAATTPGAITTLTNVVTTPTKEVTTPTSEVTTPTGKVTIPTGGVTTPTEEVTTPTEEVTTPTEEVTTPTNEVTTPTSEVTTPTKEVTTFIENVIRTTDGASTFTGEVITTDTDGLTTHIHGVATPTKGIMTHSGLNFSGQIGCNASNISNFSLPTTMKNLDICSTVAGECNSGQQIVLLKTVDFILQNEKPLRSTKRILFSAPGTYCHGQRSCDWRTGRACNSLIGREMVNYACAPKLCKFVYRKYCFWVRNGTPTMNYAEAVEACSHEDGYPANIYSDDYGTMLALRAMGDKDFWLGMTFNETDGKAYLSNCDPAPYSVNWSNPPPPADTATAAAGTHIFLKLQWESWVLGIGHSTEVKNGVICEARLDVTEE